MKIRAIQRLQRWTKTAFALPLSEIRSRLEQLQAISVLLKENQQLQNVRINEILNSVMASRWAQNSSAIMSRNELGYWLNYLGLYGEGVEVGVHRGAYSEVLLNTWNGRLLYSVDPWIGYEQEDYQDSCNFSSEDQQSNYLMTVRCLERFGSRSAIVRKTSEEASRVFDSASLDFIYIDAQHHYEAVKEDLGLWEVKLKKGGVIGGHDYLDGHLESGLYGVKKAVDEWAEMRGYKLILTKDGPYISWFVKT